MQALSGFFFSLALVLAVVFGGQTLDYTWGPALIALAAAGVTACFAKPGERPAGIAARAVHGLVAVACGWILWRCAGSPVKEFARSDALLVVGLFAACSWVWRMPAQGVAIRMVMATLAGLALANLGIGLAQLGDPAFAWPFAVRPAGLPSGFFGHYNHYADFCLVAAVMLAARTIWGRDRILERIFQAAGSLAALACVLISGSRGGYFSLLLALMVLVVMSGLIAWRDKSRNRRVIIGLAVVLPLVVGLLSPVGLKLVQERRGALGTSVVKTADDRFRLVFIRCAIDISTEQPLAGSGSRSFGWRKNAAWDPKQDGMTDRFNDDFVHNELLQVAVDYGWIGALLVTLAAGGVGLAGVTGLVGRESTGAKEKGALDAVCCGGLAAMVGTLVHSNFSFVTHTLPGALYLGMAFGLALPRRSGLLEMAAAKPWPRIIATCGVVPAALVLGWVGWIGTQTYRTLWPALFGREMLAAEDPARAIGLMERAAKPWPSSELTGQAGHLSRVIAERQGISPPDQEIWRTRSAAFYGQAEAFNPHDPEWAVNHANLLSLLERNDEADRAFERAVLLEGGMERNFWARYYFAAHLYGRWYRAWIKERRAGEALGQFIRARELLRESYEQGASGYLRREVRELSEGIEKSIRFLEGARVVPEPVR
jgi:O-antigen ligase